MPQKHDNPSYIIEKIYVELKKFFLHLQKKPNNIINITRKTPQVRGREMLGLYLPEDLLSTIFAANS